MIFLLSRIPSITEAKRTVYISATPITAASAYGKSETIRTTPMIGKKYSPIDLREST